jgi:hypothetical protein
MLADSPGRGFGGGRENDRLARRIAEVICDSRSCSPKRLTIFDVLTTLLPAERNLSRKSVPPATVYVAPALEWR